MFSKLFSSRGRLRVLAFLYASALAVIAAAAQAPAVRIQKDVNNSETISLRASSLQPGEGELDAGRLPSTKKMQGVSIVFNRSAAQQAELQKLLIAQQDPASPRFHRWLTPEEFGAQFGMAQGDLDKVQTWLEQQGLKVDRVARSRNLIRFSGTVGQLEQAFQTELHRYQSAKGEHLGPSIALSVPAAIAPAVQTIRNMSNFRPRPLDVKTRGAFTSGQSGTNFFAPGDIAVTYNIRPLYGAGMDGSGQSITVVGQSAIDPNDIENFQRALGLVLSACGGTTGHTLSDPPKGTYTITFTGTDSANAAVTSDSSFTLVIN